MTVQLRTFITSYESDLEAYIVMDRLVEGRAMGGTRMTPGVTLDEVADLAHNMTLKLALAQLPIGGAKAGIRSTLPAGPERDRRLQEFGRAVAPLLHGGIYLGVDQGISYPDRDLFLRAARFEVSQHPQVGKLPCSWAELWTHCQDITGFGICEAFDAASAKLSLSNQHRTVAIQGFGAVGRAVARGLERRGFHIVAVADYQGTIQAPEGLPIQTLLNATDLVGTIDRTNLPTGWHFSSAPEAWLDVDADILVLAAGGNALHEENVHRMRAGVVVEGGNFACSKAAHRLLAEKGIPVLPGIVINAGGAMVAGLVLSNLTPSGLGVDDLVSWFYTEIATRIRQNIVAVLDRATLNPRPLSEIAEALAEERLRS